MPGPEVQSAVQALAPAGPVEAGLAARVPEDVQRAPDRFPGPPVAPGSGWAAPEQILHWQRVVDDTARSKGWLDQPRSVPEDLVMLHDEVSELMEQLQQGAPWLWWHERPEGGPPVPDGISMEVADLAIRTIGLAQRRQVDWTPWLQQARQAPPAAPPGSPQFLLQLHQRISALCRWWRNGQELSEGRDPGQLLASIWCDLERWGLQQGTPLLQLVQLKDCHNRTRPWRHGGKRI